MLSPTQLAAREGRLTASRVREVLHYNPATGLFRRRLNERGGGVPVGFPVGTKTPTGHIRICVDGVRYYAHRLAWLYITGEWPAGLLDHRNNLSSDDRFENLRITDRRGNRANAHVGRNSKTGLKGVNRRSSGKYQASIWLAGRKKYLGVFATKEAAHAAYAAAATGAFGNFARA